MQPFKCRAKSIFALCLGLFFVLGASVAAGTREQLRTQKAQMAKRIAAEKPLSLPEVKYVRLITLGYNNLFGNILWFSTLDYFGKHLAGDRDYPWLGHMCSLVTSLDSRARHVYEFCSTLLSWVAREPQLSEELLTKAISSEPDYWRYYYLRGFMYWYFLDQPENAKTDLSKAASLPNAPPFLASIASRMMVSNDSPDTAIRFLQDLIANTSDKHAKKALGSHLKKAYISRDLRVLENLTLRYREQTGMLVTSLQDLVQAEMLSKIPKDPYGKEYYLDSASGEIKAGSGKKGLEFYGKTSKTGLASKLR